MICVKCGNEIPDSSKHCIICGNNLEGWEKESVEQENECRICFSAGKDGKIKPGQFAGSDEISEFPMGETKRKDPGWIQTMIGVEMLMVFLLSFIIAGLLEEPGFYNNPLHAASHGFSVGNTNSCGTFLRKAVLESVTNDEVKALFGFIESRADNFVLMSQIRIEEYDATMELWDGPCIGKYIVIHNDCKTAIDVKARFDFYDAQGNVIEHSIYKEYGIATHGRGVVLGQSENTDVRSITFQLYPSISDNKPVTEYVDVYVEDREENGIRVTVHNNSDMIFDDFRIRVLWFQNGKLETVAYRWLEQDDHALYAGIENTVDFNRKWGRKNTLFFSMVNPGQSECVCMYSGEGSMITQIKV